MKKSAFTLIELLVVIAIIAILAGIALPVYSKVLERSKATTDASNLKQLGLGVAAYLADNDDQMFSSSAVSSKFWPELLQSKYVTNWNVFKSPFDKRPNSNQTDAASIPLSYGVNVNALTQAAKPAWDGNWSRLAAPSNFILMAPVITGPDLTFTGLAGSALSLPEPTAGVAKLGTHTGRAYINALFADMHVTALRYAPSTDTEAFTNTAGETGLKRWKPLGL